MTPDQELPASIDNEKAILGSVLTDNDLLWEAGETLATLDFALDSNQRIYGAMLRIAEDGRPIDILTLQEELGEAVQAVGGVSYLFSLTEQLPRRLSIAEYVRIVKEKSLLRQIIRKCALAITDCHEGGDPMEILARMQGDAVDIAAEGGEDAAIHVAAITQEVFDRIERDMVGTVQDAALGLTTGLEPLDRATKGLFPGEYTVIGGEAGGFKLMDVDEMIPTPYGWIRNGDLEDGDAVFGDDGMPHRIVKAHPVQEEEGFRVSFDDGSSTVVHAGHLWHTLTIRDRLHNWKISPQARARRRELRGKTGKGIKPWMVAANNAKYEAFVPLPSGGSVKTTEEIAATLTKGKNKRINHSIRLTLPVQMPHRELPVDPYLLGVWLGDGQSSGGRIYVAEEDAPDILQNLEAVGAHFTPTKDPIAYGLRGLKVRLREQQLLNNKHVPNTYLWASEVQRLELLRGLMDTDGCAHRDGNAVFTNTNKLLALDVYHLAASLGVKPHWGEYRATLYGKDCGPKYHVTWTATLPCFKLKRKAANLPRKVRETQNWRYIVEIEPVGKVKMRCITTSNPTGLYLFGYNFNITHNTALLTQILLANAKKKIPVGLFSIEMKRAQIVSRMVSSVNDSFTATQVRDPRLISMFDKEKLKAVRAAIDSLPIWVDDTARISLDKLKARARAMIRKHKIKLLGVDYLQLIIAHGKLLADQIIQEATFGLRDLSKEEGIHIIALSQYSRDTSIGRGKKSGRQRLKGSSAIEQSAQNLFLVEADEPKDDEDEVDAQIDINKQREGGRKKVKCRLSLKHLTFKPEEVKYNDPG